MTTVNTKNPPSTDLPCLAPSAPHKAFRARRRPQAGQSVLIVLGVLFLIAFLGALFVLVVIRNLENAQRQNQVLTADYYAQAGVNYANSMLQSSPLGADWRPPLQYAVATPADVPGYVNPGGTLAAAPVNDPDFQWISDGYTRYNLANGRFLLRITYNPAAATLGTIPTTGTLSPTAKYLKIEVVGRQGVVDSSDPTTYTNSPPESLRAERTAYKPIGLVDYARFITNKDNTSATATLGVPSGYDATNGITTSGVMDINGVAAGAGFTTLTLKPYPITTTFGNPSAYTANAAAAAGGGSVRCNGNLRLYGSNQVYLDGQFGDDWEIEGNLTFDQYTAPTSTNGLSLSTQATDVTLTGTDYGGNTYSPIMPNIYPSNDSNFTTVNGLIRDGNSGNDSAGYPRSIGRLNPPLIDSTDPVTNLTRYQVLTKPTAANTFIGQGTPGTASALATVYINNSGDIQTETTSVSNPTTLREEWLRTAGATPLNWNGNFYNPPGVSVTFGQLNNASLPATQTYWGMTLTRTDTDALGGAVKWPGTNSSTVQVAYAQQPGGFTFNADTPVVFLSTNATPVSDVVVYADGNVRVRGVVSNPNAAAGAALTPQHVTIVTNGIGYVEGSLLRGVEASANQAASSVALLARQYVCLNTTQFLTGTADFTGTNQPESTQGITGDYFLDFTKDDSLTFNDLLPIVYQDGAIYSGAMPTYIDGTGNFAEHLYVSEQSGDSSVSKTPATGDYQATFFGATGQFPSAQADAPTRATVSLPLATVPAPQTMDVPFALTFNTDSISTADWMLERAAVLPADIKIEAILYAENNSFFVIPGDWFNTDTSDVLSANPATPTTVNFVGRPNDVTDAAAAAVPGQYLFPFHGQPIDMQITIEGSVAENMPADIADQAAWMRKWGWIPRYHGSKFGTDGSISTGADVSPHVNVHTTTALPTTIAPGLNFVYDPLNGFPVVNPTAATPTYLRQDVYGRVLPATPALPVSPDLLYNGQPTS